MRKNLVESWQRVIQQVEFLKHDYYLIHELSQPSVALFGAGMLGLHALQYFQSKKYHVHCFVDNCVAKQGTLLHEIPIVSANHELAASAPIIIVTAKTSVKEINIQMSQLGLRCMSFDAFFVMDNLENFIRVRNENLHDSASVQCLDGILLSMLTNSPKYCFDIFTGNQYFCLPHFLHTEDYFVDAGAYVGDTSEKFIWANNGMFQHIHLFEPGKEQFHALECRMKRLIAEWAIDPGKISMINAGLSDQNGRAQFTSSINLAATTIRQDVVFSDEESSCTPLWSLDSYMEQFTTPVTFLKADIEGMEILMLKGARKTIRQYKPKLAISVYHKPGDLFAIIDTVKDYVPEYKISLRQHYSNLSETVLYCWTDDDVIPTGSI